VPKPRRLRGAGIARLLPGLWQVHRALLGRKSILPGCARSATSNALCKEDQSVSVHQLPVAASLSFPGRSDLSTGALRGDPENGGSVRQRRLNFSTSPAQKAQDEVDPVGEARNGFSHALAK